MRSQAIISAVAIAGVAAQTGQLGNALVVNDNPAGVVYKMTFPENAFFSPNSLNGNIKGSVVALASANETGVQITIQFSNLPKEGGPFLYHIHDQPVPADGNCTATLGHLDPFIRGETPACDSTQPDTCQVGDLSGKHGTINSTDFFRTTYIDDFASTKDGLGSFLGNRSIVIHFNNVTRITCGNFVQIAGPFNGGSDSCGAPAASGTASIAGSTPTGTTPSASASLVPFTGAAAGTAVSMSSLMVAVAAIVIAL